MNMIPFILSLSRHEQITQPDPETEQFPLVFGDSVVTLTGAQTLTGVLTGAQNLYYPRVLYHEGKTYNLYHGIYQSEGLGQGYLLVYDEKRGLLKPYRVTNTEILHPEFGVPDSHTTPQLQIDNDGNLFAFQERTHDTPIDIYKGHFNDFALLAEKINPGTGATAQSSYHNFLKLPDGNGWSWCRMTRLYEAYSGAHGASVSASDGFESWGSLVRNTTNPRPVTTTSHGNPTDRTRHYPHLPYYRQIVSIEGEDHIICFRTQRTDNYVTGLGDWNKYHVHATPVGTGRGTIFKNLVGTPYTQDVTSANYMDETDLDTNFMYHDSGADDANSFIPVGTCSLTKVFIVTGDGDTGDLLLHIIDIPTRTQDTKALNISGYTVYDPATKQSHAVRHLAYIEDGGYLEVGIEIDYPSSVIKTHIFRSYDLGDTFIDMGDVTPELSTSARLITFPANYHDIPANRNFMVTLYADDGTTSNTQITYVKRAAKQTIQSETPDVIVPVSSYSDANDLFHYVATDGKISRSGNNVTGLTDQFGLRNATGANSPQWNGSDAISLNGTNQRFTLSATGLTALTKCTLFCVVRMTGAGNKIILSLSDNTAASSFLAFAPHDINVSAPSVILKQPSIISLRDHGQDSVNTDAWALVAFVMDGRCKSDIYVNGKKQFYDTFDYTTLAHFQKRGSMNFGATPNAVVIGGIDVSGTDTYTALSFKEIIFKNTVYNYEDYRAIEKKLADDHGITLNYGYA